VSLLGNFRFLVVVDEVPSLTPAAVLLSAAGRIAGKGPQAGFQEVTGLGAEMEVLPYAEGGANTFLHQLPVRHSYPRLVLKRGVVREKSLWDWYRAGLFGTLGARRGGVIVLLDSTGEPALTWGFVGGLAVKWTGPSLNAMQNEVAVESLEIAHEGLIPL
jgi:phage tail-like protein